jgi:serine/threonine-protein kinase
MPQILGPPAAGDPSPKKLGRYECAEQIGGDSGFETYRARVKGLAGLDRSFALKVLRLKRSEVPAAVSEPFLQAARRSATVADPRVAKVVEADSGEGVVFAVTPFMDGVDLAQFLERAREAGVLATGKGEAARRWHRLVAYLGAEVARGLQAAHAQDPPFLHGALCPGNVFITSRGAIRLLDFGLRASVRRPFEPRPRRLLPYIAPELAAPAADCTRAGDVYSLGVLLFELCNGDLPPQGRRAADTQIALSLLPEDLGLLIGRLLSMSPAARPAAADVVSSLAAVHADTSEAALVADLGSLIQGSSTAALAESAEASLADAPEGVDDAPPPPSEVEHDDAYGLEGPLQPRTGEPVQAKPAGQPAVRSVQSFFSSPVPSPGEEPSAMQDAGEAMPPSVPAFDAPPATWGARALAALGGQAGIASPFGDPASGLGLFDEIEAEPAQPDLPGPPPVGPASGMGGREASLPPFALDESTRPAPARTADYPLEVVPGVGSQASGDEIRLAEPEVPRAAEQPRGHALLEDELVDSPDGARSTSPWPPAGAFGLPGQLAGGIGGPPAPEAVRFADDRTPSAEAVAFAEDETQSAPESNGYLDDGDRPAVAPGYFADSAQPLPKSEIAALPEAGVARTPSHLRPAPELPSGGVARSTAVRRPQLPQTSIPKWATSSDDRAAKHPNRRLIWVVVGSVLGASVLAGGLAGFFVGARGKSWNALLGGRQPSAQARPQAATPLPAPAADDVPAKTEQPSEGETRADPPAVRGSVPAVAGAPSPAKKAGAERPEKLAAPITADKKVIAAGATAPATWSKGVSDSAGTGQLVSVSITSQPAGADVWISGKERGRTPLQARIESGLAQVVLVLAGHVSAAFAVTASEGTQVSKELLAVEPPMTGDARFRAECTTQGKLPIVVDGKETGVLCPFSKLRVDPGVHKIGLFVPALGQVHEKEVTLHPGVRSIVFTD